MQDLANRVPNDGKRFTVDVHHGPDGVQIGGRNYSPDELADVLRRSGWDGKSPIRLLSCDSGDFAGDLAKKLGVDVTAPNGKAWSDGNGNVFASSTAPDGGPTWPPDGGWETHSPDGTKNPASDDAFHPSKDGEDPGERPDDAASRDADTPQNNPDWDKNNPEDRTQIQDQVDQIREEIMPKLNEYGTQAWDEMMQEWPDRLPRYDNVPEFRLPMIQGTLAHTNLERMIHENMDDLIRPDSGWRIRTEVSFDPQGNEITERTNSSRRPDILLEREVQTGGSDTGNADTDGQEIDDPEYDPTHAIDYKTGNATHTNKWASEVEERIDPVLTPETLNPNLDESSLPPVRRRPAPTQDDEE
ncbi:hypothetical protein [Saccharopolyspora shandongensis]|uniref:hypothetical protein n=1 Tax=Saccharopolyspora shandongensis TaxID=418495 RepID=UPI0033ECC3C4